jgi:multidrug efflux pump subunit AcrA (membrane-fusion protein)
VGTEPGEVVPAGRMVVHAARKEGRDTVFDVPAQIKDRAPSNPEITVALSTDASVTAKGRVRELSPRAAPVTGTFKVRIGLTDPPAGLPPGWTVTGTMEIERRPPRRSRSRARGWCAPARSRRCGSSIRRPRPSRSG